jgi:hypothetical protein
VVASPGWRPVGAPDSVGDDVSGWAPVGAAETPGSAAGCCVCRFGRPPRMPGKISGLRPNGDSGDAAAPAGDDGAASEDGSPALGAGSVSVEGVRCC